MNIANLIKLLLSSLLYMYSYSSFALDIDTVFIREEKLAASSDFSKNNPTSVQPTSEGHNSFSVGDKLFVDIKLLRPTQLRKSEANIADKIMKSKGIIYDEGKSMFSLDEAVPVFKGIGGFLYLIDGHHSVMASLQNNAKTMPILILDDLSDLSIQNFWEIAINKNYAYLQDFNGQTQSPPSGFNDLIEDPVRYFAAITAFKCTPGKPIEAQEYAKYLSNPLWLKVGKSLPFIEFNMANQLYKHNFLFHNEDRLDKAKMATQVETAREIFLANPLEGIILLPKDPLEAIKLQTTYCKQQAGIIESSFNEE